MFNGFHNQILSILQQPSIDHSGSSTLPRNQTEQLLLSNEADDIVAEPLERILEHKSIREKRDTMEKKLKTLKKSHDKKKVEVSQNEVGDGKKSSLFSNNRLVKRLSAKSM